MELTKEHYERAAIAYDAYCKQTGGKSLVSGDKLPSFDSLRQEIKDAWAASAIALSLEADRTIRSLAHRAAFGDQCYQDRCENAYVEQAVMKKAVAECARRCAEIAAEVSQSYDKDDGFPSHHAVGAETVAVTIRREFGIEG